MDVFLWDEVLHRPHWIRPWTFPGLGHLSLPCLTTNKFFLMCNLNPTLFQLTTCLLSWCWWSLSLSYKLYILKRKPHSKVYPQRLLDPRLNNTSSLSLSSQDSCSSPADWFHGSPLDPLWQGELLCWQVLCLTWREGYTLALRVCN